MFNIVKKTFAYGAHQVTLETGEIARQSGAAILVSMDDTVVLVTVVGNKSLKPGQDFFPLTVDYIEKTYAAGKIPGGFFKREGRPSEKETLTSRLIDRPLRPLFPEGFYNEVQVVAMVVSLNPEIDPDIPAMIGASAAMAVSGIPFDGPLGAARVGYINDQYVLNPTLSQLKESRLDLVVAGTQSAVLMVESEADILPEDVMLGAVVYGHEQMQVVINAINELVEEAGKPEWDWTPAPKNEELVAKLNALVEADLQEAFRITSKQQRTQRINEISAKAVEVLTAGEGAPDAATIGNLFFDIESRIVRGRILAGEPRIDGRDTRTVRPLAIEVGVLDKTHGSALFTRGETQALVVATLGTARDAQLLDTLEGEKKDPFMLHYNFPPYSVGECGRMGATGRREIGHGRLARRGVAAMLPSADEFPYTIRVVSEITESNGSSSMASVCGASLALMDAGVPMKAPVAGIAMGLVLEGEKFAVLTDILGDEDHLGDMDFKVAGTAKGVTALQMDIKIQGITEEIMEQALEQALEARLNILGQMNQVIAQSRSELSANAPTMIAMKIDQDKIRDVIGKGGATIRAICEETKASIDIEDDGSIKIFGETKDAAEAAKQRVLAITAEAEIGKIYVGKVERIVDFGAFVNILPGKDGLVHISMLSDQRVEKVTDVLQEGQEVKVLVLDVDNRGRIKLSIKDVAAAEASGV